MSALVLPSLHSYSSLHSALTFFIQKYTFCCETTRALFVPEDMFVSWAMTFEANLPPGPRPSATELRELKLSAGRFSQIIDDPGLSTSRAVHSHQLCGKFRGHGRRRPFHERC